ncbi:MAG: hypothetical protein F6J86_08225 [Symploca sp. SIO1B1]|nr:hypothetical protein [Symploca sp. SIO2D2]NER21428.1 hypothetical protein [Symploca sp. SIO1C2]NER93814.1 hypothetical protein [Symploca sp. SIO1B1]
MNQDSVKVTYSLEEVLGQINQKLDRMDEKFENFQKDVDEKFDNLQKEIVEVKIGQVRLEGEIKNLEVEVKGIGKRLDTQEFINRSVVVGFVLAIAAGTVKLFFPSFPN